MTEIQMWLTAAAGDASQYSAAGLLAVLFFTTFVSEDIACLSAGTLAASGHIGFASAVAACFLGILAGDLALYWAGRLLGRRVIETRLIRRTVSTAALDRAGEWLEKRGAYAVFLSRFVTGLRLPTYIAAGILKTDFARFAFYFAIAAAVWTPLLVGAAAFWQRALPGSFLAAAAAALISVRLAVELADRKKRRLLVGRILRITRWEFWPLWIFYIPVVFWVIALAFRYRGLTVFSAANPGIPGGGFAGESKDAIYRMLAGSPAADGHLLRHRLIGGTLSAEEKIAAAAAFIEEESLDFPVVLKPDRGERGKGVEIVGSHSELEHAFARTRGDAIVQEFYSGDEASIFYFRFPGQQRGRIFSITEKRFPAVVGDGVSTLEELILRDRRAVCVAKSYFEVNRGTLSSIPSAGESVQLIRIGTHSRGAVFLDGSWIRSEALESRIDAICRGVEGFYFGRFDIRARSFAEMQDGENFRIIELNGVTSESTNIYDPRYRLIDAYRILFEQWRIAFEIGRENIKMGAKPASVLSLLKGWLSGRSEAGEEKGPDPDVRDIHCIRAA